MVDREGFPEENTWDYVNVISLFLPQGILPPNYSFLCSRSIFCNRLNNKCLVTRQGQEKTLYTGTLESPLKLAKELNRLCLGITQY